MAKTRPSRIGPQVAWGTVLIVICLILIVLWNVVIVHLRGLAAPGHWWILAIGLALFATVLVGLITFMVNLIKQIRTNQAQSNFIDAVTHELKTPLTSLKLHAQSLELGRVPPERHPEFHRILLDDVERLDQLVDHVLEAARLDNRPLAREPFSLKRQIEHAIETVSKRHAVSPSQFALDGPDSTLLGDADALQLVLVNLLDNAVKYSRPEGLIRVTVTPTPKRTLITIQDQGIGIPPDQHKRIFERFYRSGNEMTRLKPGTGLGLFIVRETLKRLGGTITVESAGDGTGSTFVIGLPCRAS